MWISKRRIEALEAENADRLGEIADLQDRLFRIEAEWERLLPSMRRAGENDWMAGQVAGYWEAHYAEEKAAQARVNSTEALAQKRDRDEAQNSTA